MDSAELLFTARWHSALSQAEVAERAQTSQQTLQRYERGRSQPTVPVLERLLAACGMRLDLGMTAMSLFEDPWSLALLERPPLERLPEPYALGVGLLIPAMAAAGLKGVLADKAAARLYGAPVRVPFCEFWVDGAAVRFEEVEAILTSIGGRSFYRFGPEAPRSSTSPPGIPSAKDKECPDEDEEEILEFERLWSNVHGGNMRFRAVPDFAEVDARSRHVAASSLKVTAASDTSRSWHARDRDHLLLRRALVF